MARAPRNRRPIPRAPQQAHTTGMPFELPPAPRFATHGHNPHQVNTHAAIAPRGHERHGGITAAPATRLVEAGSTKRSLGLLAGRTPPQPGQRPPRPPSTTRWR